MKYTIRYKDIAGEVHEVITDTFSVWREDVGFGGDGWGPRERGEVLRALDIPHGTALVDPYGLVELSVDIKFAP